VIVGADVHAIVFSDMVHVRRPSLAFLLMLLLVVPVAAFIQILIVVLLDHGHEAGVGVLAEGAGEGVFGVFLILLRLQSINIPPTTISMMRYFVAPEILNMLISTALVGFWHRRGGGI